MKVCDWCSSRDKLFGAVEIKPFAEESLEGFNSRKYRWENDFNAGKVCLPFCCAMRGFQNER